MTAPLVTVADVEDHADRLLAGLGDTDEQVEESLWRADVTGVVDSCRGCPIAVYLLRRLAGVWDVSVTPSRIVLFLESGEEVGLPTPGAVQNFIVRFDTRQYRRLIAAGGAS